VRTFSEDGDARIKNYWCSYTFYTSNDRGRTRTHKSYRKKSPPPPQKK